MLGYLGKLFLHSSLRKTSSRFDILMFFIFLKRTYVCIGLPFKKIKEHTKSLCDTRFA